MSTVVFSVVLLAAALHASWNALVKGGLDKSLSMSAVVLGQGLCGAAALLFVPAPAPESWPFLAVSVLLHIGYQAFLMSSYRIGDLTQVYPIARGSAPLLVALVSVLVLGVSLSATELAAVLVIGVGIISLGLVRQADGLRNRNAAVLALITGLFIASYSLVDGMGARAAGTAVGFFGWVAVLNAPLYLAAVWMWRAPAVTGLPRAWKVVFLGGGASFAAYALVVWAFMQAPIALVTALRETSIVFALLIGVVFLNERLDLGKLASTMATLTGAALMRLGKG